MIQISLFFQFPTSSNRFLTMPNNDITQRTNISFASNQIISFWQKKKTMKEICEIKYVQSNNYLCYSISHLKLVKVFGSMLGKINRN